MTQLPVKVLPSNDSGRLLVRLNKAYRAGIPRYGIANLSNAQNAKSVEVLVLGHDDASAIFMPYDIREALGVDKGGNLNFEISKVGWLGKIGWLLKTPDPAVHVPAWLALISVLLGVISIAIALCGCQPKYVVRARGAAPSPDPHCEMARRQNCSLRK